jgi:predicted phosphoadenosine phosphosulfate sulfurtransferase
MKRVKIIRTLIDHIGHDPFAYNPNWTMERLPPVVQNNYAKITRVLSFWQKKGYITLIENNTIIFIVHPEKLPGKEQLLSESLNIFES